MKRLLVYGLSGTSIAGRAVILFLLLVSPCRPETEPGSAPPDSFPKENGSESSLLYRVEFNILEARQQENIIREMAESAAGVRSGDAVTEASLARSLERLKSCGRFEDVSLETRTLPDGQQTIFRLQPYYYVKDLLMTGAWPLFEKEVRNAMTLYAGAPYTRQLLNEQKALIRELYLREGISIDTITALAERDAEDGNYIVSIHISPGRWFRVSDIEVKGCRGLSLFRWRYRLGGVRELLPVMGKRFVRKDHDEAIKTVLKKYREKNYFDAVIRDTVVLDSSGYSVMLRVVVEEGPRYGLVFLGNNSVSRRKLLKQCLFGSGNLNNAGVRKSREALAEFYRSLGFEEVRVDAEMTAEAGQKTVIFKIQEGRLSRVVNLSLSGNVLLEKKDILEQVLLKSGKPFSGQVLAADVEGIHALYLQKGFSGTSIDTILNRSEADADDIGVSVEFKISEGRQRLVKASEIEVSEALQGLQMKKKLLLKPGGPYVKSLVQRDRETLSAMVSEEGYPYCRIRSEEMYSADSAGLSVTYRVEEGTRAYMGRVYTVGNFKTAPSVIEREMLMKKGVAFSLRGILESQRNIQNLPLFSSVQMKPSGLEQGSDTVNIFLDLEEERSLYLKVRSGYESDIGVFAESRLGDKNLFGLNKHGWVAGRLHHKTGRLWEYGDAGWRAESGLLEPRLWGSRISASTVLSQERVNDAGQDFFVDRTTASVGLMRRFWRVISLGSAFEYELRKATGVRTDSTRTSEDLRDLEGYRNNLITRPSLSYDSRDSFIRPNRGVLSSYTIEISTGMDNNIDDFVRYEWMVKGFASPVPGLVLGAVGRWQRISETGVADDQLLYLGGTQDVRGFPKNQLDTAGGNLAVSGSLEARIDLFWGFELALFSDAGNVSTTADPFAADVYSPGKFKYTAGTGLRYITPIGPVGLLYGHQLNPVGYGTWHFSLGYTF